MFVRHWDTWVDGTISTLFSVALKQTDARGLRADVRFFANTPVTVNEPQAVQRFERVQPSLHQIFLERVGAKGVEEGMTGHG